MRLTQAKTRRWIADLAKAHALIEKVETEQRAHLQAAKGGRYHDLLGAVGATKDARLSAFNATQRASAVQDGEDRRRA